MKNLFQVSRHELLYRLKYPLWILEGGGDMPLSVAFAGFEHTKNYFSRLVFGGGCRERAFGTVWSWDLVRKAEAAGGQLLLCEVPLAKERFTPLSGDLRMPALVALDVDLSGDLAALLKRKRYGDIRRKVVKNGWQSQVRSDTDAFDAFYFDMYRPMIRARHENRAVEEAYDDLKKLFLKSGEIVFVTLNDERIGGMLIDYAPAGGHLRCLGILEGREKLIRSGVSEAAYFFSLLRVKERGLPSASLGHCRPFLRDGIFQYKLHFDARVRAHHAPSGSIRVKFLKKNAALGRFFTDNPFISFEKDGYALRAVPGAETGTDWAPVLEKCLKDGMSLEPLLF